ncbi:MAG: ATP synthase F0 subunit C [Deltaproteobacteria bacterium]
MKKSLKMLFYTSAITLMASPAFAETVAAAPSGGGSLRTWFFISIALATSICMTVAAIGVSFNQASAIRSAVDGIARNPGAAGKILTTMLIGVAMIESLAIYVLVIMLILLFANPFTSLL